VPDLFADVWPEVSRALVRFLCRRGASDAQAQDIAQDVALKVLTRHIPFTSSQDLLRWCYPVARNALVDAQRASARFVAVPDEDAAFDVPDMFDTHRVVESRLRLQDVLVGIRQLSSADQEALAPLLDDDGPADPTCRRESTRLAVRRHRARARLTALVGPVAAVFGWVLGARPARTSARFAPAAVAVSLSLASVAGGAAVVQTPSHEALQATMVSDTVAAPAAVSAPARPVAPPARAVAPVRRAAVAADETRVVVPATGVVVRTGTRAPRGRELACASTGGERSCVDRPTTAIARESLVPPLGG
jgi:hypothetical protein